MRDKTIIDRLYDDNHALISYLLANGEISLKSDAESKLRKTLLLSAASYFENEIKRIILEFCEKNTNGNSALLEFIKNKAIFRQYHTYFQWSSNNANSFFGLFGGDLKSDINNDIKSNKLDEKSIKSFLEVGDLRNRMVHDDFATFNLDKTADEIYDLYKNAILFLKYLEIKLIG